MDVGFRLINRIRSVSLCSAVLFGFAASVSNIFISSVRIKAGPRACGPHSCSRAQSFQIIWARRAHWSISDFLTFPVPRANRLFHLATVKCSHATSESSFSFIFCFVLFLSMLSKKNCCLSFHFIIFLSISNRTRVKWVAKRHQEVSAAVPLPCYMITLSYPSII